MNKHNATYDLYIIYVFAPIFLIKDETDTARINGNIAIHNVQNAYTIIKRKCAAFDSNNDKRFDKIYDSLEIVGTYKSRRLAAKHVIKLRKLNDGYYYSLVQPED